MPNNSSHRMSNDDIGLNFGRGSMLLLGALRRYATTPK